MGREGGGGGGGKVGIFLFCRTLGVEKPKGVTGTTARASEAGAIGDCGTSGCGSGVVFEGGKGDTDKSMAWSLASRFCLLHDC